MREMFTVMLIGLVGALLVLASGKLVYAHCDTMNGPVVSAARKALETGDVNHVLIWVKKDDEGQIRAAFKKALEVRKFSPQAKDLADNYFFETLVRIHRAGEGAPYTGLKPAGEGVGPAVSAADKAIESSDPKEVLRLVSDAVYAGLKARYDEVMAKSKYKTDDVKAGREYVAAYIEFVHYVDGLYDAAEGAVPEDASGAQATGHKD